MTLVAVVAVVMGLLITARREWAEATVRVETVPTIELRQALLPLVSGKERERLLRMRPRQGTRINGSAQNDLGYPEIQKAFADEFAKA
jgi:hypothetical protein